jgi:uncharacterized RDD family membrane protein YckC
VAPYGGMAKKCGFCSFSTDDETAFTEHMRTVHQWGVPAAPAATITIAPQGEPGVPRFCGVCGAPRDAESTNFCRNCGTPFTGAATAVRQEASPAFAPKAGFWRRTGAYLIDTILVLALSFLVGIVVGLLGVAMHLREGDMNLIAQLAGNLLSLGYFLYFWSGRGAGQTLGMKRLGIRVIRTDGKYMSVGRAFLRNIGLGISFLVFLLGVIWVAFDKNKQGWHDKIADTYVVMA